MRKTKFDMNLAICQKVLEAFSDIGSEQLAPIIEGFSKSIDQIKGWVNDNNFPAPKSEIAKGLEQGINDLSLLIEDLEPNFRSKAFSAFYQAVNSVNPDYFEKQNAKIQRVIKRGKIKTESEFNLLRNRLDRIEGNGSHEEKIISKLVELYEIQA
ncbi:MULTISPECIES: hypothetical protein [unclassified Agarivorans]|uniref:hypothetical protein n=1 Tax=unclassified Agarivorans TaxID=2636026 RepID=UPI003D7C52F7